MAITVKNAQYFIATAEAGQVSRAALDLNISQSAVTAAIKSLESHFEFELFERRRDGMFLTAEGIRFVQHAQRIVDAAREASQMGSDSPSDVEGEVRLGMTYTVAGYFAVPLIERCRRRFPKMDIKLFEWDRGKIEDCLSKGNLDLAVILTSNLGNRDSLSHVTLVTSQRRLWVARNHELLKKETINLKDLCAYDYIALTIDEAIKTQRSYWEIANVFPNVVFKTKSVEAVRTMVAAGIGVTVLSDMVYRSWSLDGHRIERRDLVDEVPTMDVGLVWDQENALSDAAGKVRDYIIAALKDPS